MKRSSNKNRASANIIARAERTVTREAAERRVKTLVKKDLDEKRNLATLMLMEV